LKLLNAQAEDPNLWNDPAAAQKVMKQRTALEDALTAFDALTTNYTDTKELIALAEEEGDQAMLGEATAELQAIHVHAHQQEMETLLSGEADSCDAYIDINAGAGGTESQDWAQMLERMYMRWANARDMQVEIIHEMSGEEAGIKSATLLIKGKNAHGWLNMESGVHRLVRISPFDSNARRHTSFASVWVYPAIDDSIHIEIIDKDVRVDTYRASGAGGQHINKTDSAVRLTHMPSGIVVQCQSNRSQHKNRATAWNMLRAKLYEAELKKREEETQAKAEAKTDIAWGHQIRSYVLQPYQMVKDLRTQVESSNPTAVLDGDLDEFLTAALAAKIQGGGAGAS